MQANKTNSNAGLVCEIFRWSLGDCSNAGLSSRCTKVTLIGLGKHAEIFEPTPERPAVRIVKRTISGKEYIHAQPIERPQWAEITNSATVGPMAGGTFIYSSDSRFPSSYPIALHDRWETQAHYDALTR